MEIPFICINGLKIWEFPFFVPKTINIFVEFPMKNVGKIVKNPMSSVGGVHLIFEIAYSVHVSIREID